jgi:hypothetical protein
LIHKLTLALLASALQLACAGSGGKPAEPNGVPADAGSIRCTFAYRESNELMAGQSGNEPGFQFEQRVTSVQPNEAASQTLGLVTLTLRYDVDDVETDSFSLNARADDKSLLSILYQLGAGLPKNQFAGGHGFTGLLYLTHPSAGGDYQAYCEAIAEP